MSDHGMEAGGHRPHVRLGPSRQLHLHIVAAVLFLTVPSSEEDVSSFPARVRGPVVPDSCCASC